MLLAYERFLAKAPPAKRAVANRELEASLAGVAGVLDAIVDEPGPFFAFHLAALSEAASAAYGAAGSGKETPLRARYEAIVAKPMRPTSRRAWAAYHLHSDEEPLRALVADLAKADDPALALGLSALNQALSDVYSKASKAPE